MTVGELRGKNKTELQKLLKDSQSQLVKMRLDRKVGTLADGSVIAAKKKEIAQILTVVRECDILSESQEGGGSQDKANVEKKD
jgi:ribosomal protein L29